MTKSCQLLVGQAIANKELLLAADKIKSLSKPLRLATVQVGESRDSELYSRYLKNLLGRLKVGLESVILPKETKESALIREIGKLNGRKEITGILVFSPLPQSLCALNVLNGLDPRKDVEGRTFLKSNFGVSSPTANAVLALIESTQVSLKGLEAIVVGHSDLVGKPTAVLLMDHLATVTVCHKETRDLAQHVERADVLVAAVGKPHVIKGEWIKPGAIVIDVGENILDGKVIGDVEFEAAQKRASFISPVPGGVGPVTNVMLIKNLIKLHEFNMKRQEPGFNGNC